MKNLKLFVFSLCLMLVAVLSVNATCHLPGTTGNDNECQAKIGNTPFDTFDDAWIEATKNGGTIELLGEGYNLNIITNSYTISKNVTILANDKTNIVLSKAVTVANNGSLTITGANLTVNNTMSVAKGGTLNLNNVTATTGGTLVDNYGTVVVNGGTVTATGTSSVFVNNENLTLSGVTVTAKKATMTNVASHNSNTTISGGKYNVLALLATPSSVSSATTTPANILVKDSTVDATNGVSVTGKSVVTFENATFNVTGQAIALDLKEGTLNVNGGKVVASNGDAIAVTGTEEAVLNITNGTAESTKGGYALALVNPNATYAISGGTFNSKVTGSAAMYIKLPTAKVDGKVSVAEVYQGILTGGKYLNNIIAKVDIAGGNYDLSEQLVAEGYEVKEEGKYKVVVKAGATDVEPEKQPDASKPGSTGSEELPPDTYDAGLTYMGLAVLAVGASVVSVRKLRNN